MTRKLSALALSTLAVLTLALATAPPADAGWPFGRHRARRCRPVAACYTPRHATFAPAAPPRAVAAAQAPPAASQATVLVSGPTAFLGWLNDVRSRAGLRPVGWSADLASDAAVNSSLGFGHAHLGRARRQNAGVGDLGTVSVMWLQSAPHAAALLDPFVTHVGLANVGGVWTFSAN